MLISVLHIYAVISCKIKFERWQQEFLELKMKNNFGVINLFKKDTLITKKKQSGIIYIGTTYLINPCINRLMEQ